MKSRFRGLLAVVRLVLSAADHYVTALVGLPPIVWCVGQVAAIVRQTYREGRYGPASDSREVVVHVVEGEIVDG